MKSKTWKRKGDVYYEIATNPSPQLVLYRNGAMDTATADYLKALVVEKKENGKPVIEDKNDIIYTKLVSIGNSYMSEGAKAADNKDYKRSVQLLDKARMIFTELSKAVDRSTDFVNASNGALANISLAYTNMGDDANAIRTSEELLTVGYDSAWVYQNLSYLYLKKGDKTKAGDILTKGKQKFPSNADLFMADLMLALDNKETERAKMLIEEGKTKFPTKKADIILQEVNFYLGQNDNEKALASLEEAIKIYAGSQKKEDKEILTILYFNAGIIYDNLAEKETEKGNNDQATQYVNKAQEYYGKTLEIDPNYVSVYNQQANFHIRMANNYITQANLLPFEKQKEYDALKKKADEEYLKGTELLEKGYAIKKDETIKKNLMEMYKKTQQLDKLKALEAEQ
jgi:tetratricopeptide (TPR) repeat protein